MKVSVQWGPSIESVTAAEWVKQRKKKQFDLPTRMPTGSFTDIELALTPASAAEIKQLTVGLELDQLSLRAR